MTDDQMRLISKQDQVKASINDIVKLIPQLKEAINMSIPVTLKIQSATAGVVKAAMTDADHNEEFNTAVARYMQASVVTLGLAAILESLELNELL